MGSHEGGTDPLTAEWVDTKRHYLFRRGERKCAYAHAHGDKQWDVLDAGYRKLREIPAKTKEEAAEAVIAMSLDGSLDRLIDDYHEREMSKRLAAGRSLAKTLEEISYKRARDAELKPGASAPAIPMKRETHRLLRAVALKRSMKTPGEQPSIGAVFEELVDRYRPDLEREAGAVYKRELAKKR